MVKVFLPFNKEQNPYLDEIERFSSCKFFYGNWDEYQTAFDIVNIHWPEAIFAWIEPTKNQLKELEERISLWKEYSNIVYTKHDFRRNKGTTPNFDRLFEIVEKNADVFIHLGEFSRNYYKAKYPQACHEVIYHPLYTNSFEMLDKQEARSKLQIDPNAFVLIAPGNIRKFEERDLILRAFKKIQKRNKVLICTNMYAELRFDFKGRIRLKRVFDIKKWLVQRFKTKYQSSNYIFTYSNVSRRELSMKISAADLVLIPRTDILNSGNVFLGLTFNKPIVGPDIGNIAEHIKELKLQVFDPTSFKSVENALFKAIEKLESNFSYKEEDLRKYQPQEVARKLDLLFKSLK